MVSGRMKTLEAARCVEKTSLKTSLKTSFYSKKRWKSGGLAQFNMKKVLQEWSSLPEDGSFRARGKCVEDQKPHSMQGLLDRTPFGLHLDASKASFLSFSCLF